MIAKSTVKDACRCWVKIQGKGQRAEKTLTARWQITHRRERTIKFVICISKSLTLISALLQLQYFYGLLCPQACRICISSQILFVSPIATGQSTGPFQSDSPRKVPIEKRGKGQLDASSAEACSSFITKLSERITLRRRWSSTRGRQHIIRISIHIYN